MAAVAERRRSYNYVLESSTGLTREVTEEELLSELAKPTHLGHLASLKSEDFKDSKKWPGTWKVTNFSHVIDPSFHEPQKLQGRYIVPIKPSTPTIVTDSTGGEESFCEPSVCDSSRAPSPTPTPEKKFRSIR